MVNCSIGTGADLLINLEVIPVNEPHLIKPAIKGGMSYTARKA